MGIVTQMSTPCANYHYCRHRDRAHNDTNIGWAGVHVVAICADLTVIPPSAEKDPPPPPPLPPPPPDAAANEDGHHTNSPFSSLSLSLLVREIECCASCFFFSSLFPPTYKEKLLFCLFGGD